MNLCNIRRLTLVARGKWKRPAQRRPVLKALPAPSLLSGSRNKLPRNVFDTTGKENGLAERFVEYMNSAGS
jgi:hypothetical protein